MSTGNIKIPSKKIALKSTQKKIQLTNNVDKKGNKKYIILRTLGKGSFGKVKEALHVMSGEKIAIKILEKSRIKKDDDLVRIRREINILCKVHHPNIIQLYEVSIFICLIDDQARSAWF